jgi:hypothetical protein
LWLVRLLLAGGGRNGIGFAKKAAIATAITGALWVWDSSRHAQHIGLENDKKLADLIMGGFDNVSESADTIEITISVRLTKAAADYITSTNVDFAKIMKDTEEEMELYFNNALRPFRKSVNFIFF